MDLILTHGARTHRLGRLLGSALFAMLLAALPLAAQESGIAVGSAAPSATVETLDGKASDLSQLIGKSPVVIEFWATWCENCKELEPVWLAMQKKYVGKVQFASVAVGVNQSAELVRRYVDRHKLGGTQFYDRTGKAVDAYDVPATSYVVVINKNGKVVYGGVGGRQDLDAAIRKAF
ncbi:MAG: TlpA disulfide reductase family protein [Gemmatimonadetes bacterium]|nr:TlpA disulfide reductase family protein [Gemmatimonadota bacterium]